MASAEPILNLPLDVLCSAFNFGPTLDSNQTVATLVETLLKGVSGEWIDCSDPSAPHEASKLNLSIDKAYHFLLWRPVWDFEQSVRMTSDWYMNGTGDTVKFTDNQIQEYIKSAKDRELLWAKC